MLITSDHSDAVFSRSTINVVEIRGALNEGKQDVLGHEFFHGTVHVVDLHFGSFALVVGATPWSKIRLRSKNVLV